MNLIIGFNYALRLLGVSEIEMSLIPRIKKNIQMFLGIVFTVQFFQNLSLILAVEVNYHFFSFGFILIPSLFISTRILYFYSIIKNKLNALLIILSISLTAFFNGFFFLFYYFKDEIDILNFGRPIDGNLIDSIRQMNHLIFSEDSYQFHSIAILLFFQVIYLVPLLIISQSSLNTINQLKDINENLRGKQ
jgi:hypothetical protein